MRTRVSLIVRRILPSRAVEMTDDKRTDRLGPIDIVSISIHLPSAYLDGEEMRDAAT